MKEFFKSIKFKILCGIALVLIGAMLYTGVNEGVAGIWQNIISYVVTPIQSASTAVANSFTGFFSTFFRAGELEAENEEYQEELRKLREQLVEYDELKQENERLKEMLGISEEYPNLKMVDASVIQIADATQYHTFTINKGADQGINLRDPVVTKDGLVGVVCEVYANRARVRTLLDVGTDVGCYISSTRDVGISAGTIPLAMEGLYRMSYLERSTTAAIGDMVLSSGESGIYPGGLIMGTIKEIRSEESGASAYAIVEPVVEYRQLKNVFVVTSFDGQGSVTPDGESAQESPSVGGGTVEK